MNIMKISSVFVLFVMSFNLYGEQLNVSYCGPKYGLLYVNLKSDDALYTNLSQCRFVYKYIYIALVIAILIIIFILRMIL